MKKSELIKMLNLIEGNPEVKLWNGFVEDWVDISKATIPVQLTAMTRSYWLELCRLEECQRISDYNHELSDSKLKYLNKKYKPKWEIDPYVTAEDIKEKRYNSKIVHVMQAKIKGAKSLSHRDCIEY